MMRDMARLTMRDLWRVFEAPLLILVWGFALGVLLWGSGVDVAIQVWLDDNYVQHFNNAMRWLGLLGKGTTQGALCLLVCAVWVVRGRMRGKINIYAVRKVLFAVPVFALAGAFNWLMKWGVGRGRPKEFLWNGVDPYLMKPFSFDMKAQWWSFPSGHSCSTFAIAMWLGLSFPRCRWVMLSVATVLSFSRFLSLTPHYFGDVVTGAAVGAATALGVWNLRAACRNAHGRKEVKHA
ncbi:MAG: phosphatase PAP2 family protein [Alphaproteobacteria bacterium]|nr:MAG: phosphatase PAP2 family protein [Alphaproteobacteria bacterium]